jgi:hypothetical protein
MPQRRFRRNRALANRRTILLRDTILMRHLFIILASLTIVGTQAEADGNWNCSEFDVPCSDIGFPNDICESDRNATYKGLKLVPMVDDQTCPT